MAAAEETKPQYTAAPDTTDAPPPGGQAIPEHILRKLRSEGVPVMGGFTPFDPRADWEKRGLLDVNAVVILDLIAELHRSGHDLTEQLDHTQDHLEQESRALNESERLRRILATRLNEMGDVNVKQQERHIKMRDSVAMRIWQARMLVFLFCDQITNLPANGTNSNLLRVAQDFWGYREIPDPDSTRCPVCAGTGKVDLATGHAPEPGTDAAKPISCPGCYGRTTINKAHAEFMPMHVYPGTVWVTQDDLHRKP